MGNYCPLSIAEPWELPDPELEHLQWPRSLLENLLLCYYTAQYLRVDEQLSLEILKYTLRSYLSAILSREQTNHKLYAQGLRLLADAIRAVEHIGRTPLDWIDIKHEVSRRLRLVSPSQQ